MCRNVYLLLLFIVFLGFKYRQIMLSSYVYSHFIAYSYLQASCKPYLSLASSSSSCSFLFLLFLLVLLFQPLLHLLPPLFCCPSHRLSLCRHVSKIGNTVIYYISKWGVLAQMSMPCLCTSAIYNQR